MGDLIEGRCLYKHASAIFVAPLAQHTFGSLTGQRVSDGESRRPADEGIVWYLCRELCVIGVGLRAALLDYLK